MTAENNNAIAIATLSNWLKILRQSFFLTNEKQNQNLSHLARAIFFYRTLHVRFFPRFEQVPGNSLEF